MGSKRVADHKRCHQCQVHQCWCICPIFHLHDNSNSHVSIIMHHRERHLTSNTAKMLDRCLTHSEITLRGIKDRPLSQTFHFLPEFQPLYLFPYDGAAELTKDYLNSFEKKKFQLIIPDGTWSQAQKFYRREKILQGIPCVKLAGQQQSSYGLRKQHIEGGVCTMEAAAYALGVIEGIALQNDLLHIFKKIAKRLQKSRTTNTQAYSFSERISDD